MGDPDNSWPSRQAPPGPPAVDVARGMGRIEKTSGGAGHESLQLSPSRVPLLSGPSLGAQRQADSKYSTSSTSREPAFAPLPEDQQPHLRINVDDQPLVRDSE